jgi:tetratricopeptide (TPR) repeat protein
MMYKLMAGLLACCSVQAAELPWDLSYKSALRDHPIGEQEFMRIWPSQHPQRPIHQKLAGYAQQPIEASMLIERPDGHTGDPQATWFIKTRDTALACPFHPQSMKQPCKTLEPWRVEEAMREVMAMRDPAPPVGDGVVAEADYFGKGKPLLFNYVAYVSVYIDGKTLQRAVGATELDPSAARSPDAGRLAEVFARATLSDAEFAKRAQRINAGEPEPAQTGAGGAPAASSEPAASAASAATTASAVPAAIDETEMKLRSALIEEVQGYLRNGEYRKLDALRKRLLASGERTGSGVWKLAIFYNQLMDFPSRSRDPAYWVQMEGRAKAWEKQAPTSSAARIFHVYVLLARGLAYRGNGFYKDVAKEDQATLIVAVKQAMAILSKLEKPMLKEKDPEYFRATMWVLPWGENFRAHDIPGWLQKGIQMSPDYHELYFPAAWFSQDMWVAPPDQIDDVARMTAGQKTADTAAMYARVYWYANTKIYRGKVFEDINSLADWEVMKPSYEALVARYPDPWNLNSYAYMACLAQDYPTMSEVLRRIGDRRVYATWGDGGQQTYSECERHTGEQRVLPAAEEIRKRRINTRQRLLYYAMRMNQQRQYSEGLRLINKVEELDRVLYSGRTGMQTQYNKAMSLHGLQRYQEEVDALSLGMQSQTDYSEAYFQRGLAYEAMGRKAEAREQFEVTAPLLAKAKPKDGQPLSEVEKAAIEKIRKKLGEYDIYVPAPGH